MRNCLLILFLVLFTYAVQAQTDKNISYRVGASFAFGLTHIAHNNVGVGGIAGAEKMLNTVLAGEVEASYTSFTGDKRVYAQGRNKAWAVPLLAGIKAYTPPGLYGSLRAGAICFAMNDHHATHIRPAFGAAAGVNFPEKARRINVQLGYTGFGYDGDSRGYATLAAAIIIN